MLYAWRQASGDTVPAYELRLYKRLPSTKNIHQVVDQYRIEAADDQEAEQIANNTQIPKFDDSDFAILYGPKGEVVRRLN
jgi:hypothetical protein